MSFGGLTSFAKNALLTAQKHIDSALHIEEDEEAETDDNKNEETDPDIDDYANAMPDDATFVGTETWESGQQKSEFSDVDLNLPSPPQSQWGDNSDKNVHTIVDTEPNPIRDAHEPTNIFHYSPSNSHSPDDDESSQNGQSSSAAAITSALDLSLINLEGEKEIDESERMTRGASEKTLDRFEDVGTVASSDIEVIRHMDDCQRLSRSITSSQHYSIKHKSDVPNSTSLKELQQSQTTAQLMINLEPGQQTQPPDPSEQIALLNAKLRHRDQRIEELGRLNENLKATNVALSTKNKQRTCTETKLQSQLADKEKQLNDLLEEGRRLSEYSGRQAKEIRKLKQQLIQLEVVTAARDSAVEEFQEAHQQIQEQESAITELQDECEKATQRAEQLQTELDKVNTHSENMEKRVCEQLTQLEAANAELRRLEKALQTANRERDALAKENKQLSSKLMNRRAQERVVDEREKGLSEDLQAEKAKSAVMATKIRELEQQLENLQDSQRDMALEISNANSPLINNIAALEEKIFALERQNDTLSRNLWQSNEQLGAQKRKYDIELETIKKSLEEECQNNAHKTDELAKSFGERADLQSRLKKSEEEVQQVQRVNSTRIGRLEQRVEELEAELKEKREELTEMRGKNCELQQRAIVESMQRKANQALQLTPNANSTGGAGEGEEEIGILPRRNNPLQQQKEMFFRPPKPTFSPLAATPIQSEHSSVKLNMSLPGEHSPSNYSLDASSNDHLRSELDSAHAQLFQLHERFEHLLEMYGGCLETIEEVREDNEDLRKLCKEQALRLSELPEEKKRQHADDGGEGEWEQ